MKKSVNANKYKLKTKPSAVKSTSWTKILKPEFNRRIRILETSVKLSIPSTIFTLFAKNNSKKKERIRIKLQLQNNPSRRIPKILWRS